MNKAFISKASKAMVSWVVGAGFVVGAQAATVVYEGVLIPNIASSGNVSGFSWFLDDGSGVDFWRFSAQAGQTVTFEVDRLSANLDPGLSLYRGVTTADASAFSSASNWGGLTYVGSLDDEHSPFVGGSTGPGGDPYGSFTLSTTGSYTVAIGGSLSTDSMSYPYKVIMTVSAVPEPETYAMLIAGLGVIGWLGRRRSVNGAGRAAIAGVHR